MKRAANKEFVTIPELAKLLGISRIAVFKKVKSGSIKAKKVGRIYRIPMAKVDELLGKELTAQNKNEIETAIKKTVQEYGEVLKMLGRE
jgi:excisionase family DNA binding protein